MPGFDADNLLGDSDSNEEASRIELGSSGSWPTCLMICLCRLDDQTVSIDSWGYEINYSLALGEHLAHMQWLRFNRLDR